MDLYDFQHAAIHGDEEWPGILGALRSHHSTLCPIFTGGGKTVIAAKLIEMAWRKKRRSLFVAHRGELLEQAEQRLLEATAIDRMEIGMEKAATYANDHHPVVLGSMATMRGDRLRRFPAGEFGLVVVDEAHHGAAATYRDLIDHFAAGGAKVLGLSATPWRLDGQPLDELFVSTAYEYNIADAIRDQRAVPIFSLEERGAVDLAGLSKGRGDYDADALTELMSAEAVLIRTAKAALEAFTDRPALIFTAGVKHNEKLAAYINAERRDAAITIDGTMTEEERRWRFAAYRDGVYQMLVNCMIATEGFDHPPVSGILMARLTKSLGFYLQCLGRGTRLLGRTLEESIANGKSDLLIVDMVGITGDETSLTATQALGAGHGPRVHKRASQRATEEAVEVIRELDLAVHEISEEDRRRALEGVKVEFRRTDPLGVLGIAPTLGAGSRPARKGQLEQLARHGVKLAQKQLDADELPERWLSAEDAAEALARIHWRRRQGLSSPRMAALLERYHLPGDVPFDAAKEVIGDLARVNWRPGSAMRYNLRKRLETEGLTSGPRS